ncbi:retrovirus-related pol polyprotein from transposon TNT 1-94 [Tanacetum coccineum]|uniref:Retrovirus-related pol polyprotein from transposon TNT 1-94 n=1 Tax=Tanacetum coccineum TaxID=301880 RepID=A0ABQ5FQI7_9ASTR
MDPIIILPCINGITTVSNALVDLRASNSFMPFLMFKRLGFGSPKPISMVIEMVDRSMQSTKGIVENILVKIDKFIFPVDFVIIDIVEDNKVPIILGRPMLATARARINVFGRKISLEVPGDFREPENLEEFLMNDDINWDLGDFFEENDLLPSLDMDSFRVLSDFNNEIEFIEKGLMEVLLEKPFKECVGLEEDLTKGDLTARGWKSRSPWLMVK